MDAIIQLLEHGNQLKRTARTGWAQRGVPAAEDVAAHSYGVVFNTLVLAQLVAEPIDLGRALAMAALHDLPEGLTTDIPSPAWRYLPPGIKTEVERGALGEILEGVEFAGEFQALWEELHAGETAVARLVHDADKIELFLQAVIYEEQHGNRHLAEFWATPCRFHYLQAEAIYQRLRRRREKIAGAA
jgi:putative hydrolase of HD superfamily